MWRLVGRELGGLGEQVLRVLGVVGVLGLLGLGCYQQERRVLESSASGCCGKLGILEVLGVGSLGVLGLKVLGEACGLGLAGQLSHSSLSFPPQIAKEVAKLLETRAQLGRDEGKHKFVLKTPKVTSPSGKLNSLWVKLYRSFAAQGLVSAGVALFGVTWCLVAPGP